MKPAPYTSLTLSGLPFLVRTPSAFFSVQPASSSSSLIQEAGLSSPEEDGLEGLARAHDLGRVARGQQFVERAVLEVACEQPREPLGGQVDLLEQIWVAAGQE